jgi:hypothetical protein
MSPAMTHRGVQYTVVPSTTPGCDFWFLASSTRRRVRAYLVMAYDWTFTIVRNGSNGGVQTRYDRRFSRRQLLGRRVYQRRAMHRVRLQFWKGLRASTLNANSYLTTGFVSC